jgi:hypothetical protein
MRSQIFIEVCLLLFFLSGMSRSEDIPFISMAGHCRYPAVASEGKRIYMVWLVTEGRAAKLYFRQSMDEGVTWSSALKICNDKSDCFPAAIAVNSGILHVAWMDFGETIEGELYYGRSVDGGTTWEKNFILVNTINSARYPLITCNGKDVYLTWQDVENKVYFKASHNEGRTWDGELLIGKVGKHSCYCFPPGLTAQGNNLAVVWTDLRKDKKGFGISAYGFPLYKSSKKMVSSVICRASTDNGRSWGKEHILTSTTFSDEIKDEIDNPIILSDGSLSYLFWLDRRTILLGEIFYASFDLRTLKDTVNGKNIFPAEKRSPKRPAVVFDRTGNLHCTWASFFKGESLIYYSEINPSGSILNERKQLNTNIGRFHSPIIASTPSGLVHVLWFDEPKKDTDEWSKIYLKTSRDNGLTWEDWEPQPKDM